MITPLEEFEVAFVNALDHIGVRTKVLPPSRAFPAPGPSHTASFTGGSGVQPSRTPAPTPAAVQPLNVVQGESTGDAGADALAASGGVEASTD